MAALALAGVGQVLFMALVVKAPPVGLAALALAGVAAAADLVGVVAQLQIQHLAAAAAAAAFTMAAVESIEILRHLVEVAAVRLVLVLEAPQTR